MLNTRFTVRLWVLHYCFEKNVVNDKLGNSLSFEMLSTVSALLAIKPMNANEPFATSSVLASITDIPVTVSDLMQWGKSYGSEFVFNQTEEDSDRSRYFSYYQCQYDAWNVKYLSPIYRFKIQGSHCNTPWLLDEVVKPTTN